MIDRDLLVKRIDIEIIANECECIAIVGDCVIDINLSNDWVECIRYGVISRKCSRVNRCI